MKAARIRWIGLMASILLAQRGTAVALSSKPNNANKAKSNDPKIELVADGYFGRYFSTDGDEKGDKGWWQLGMKGKYPLENELSLIAAGGCQFNFDKPGEFLYRLGYVGIEHNLLGRLTYGRSLGVSKAVTDFTNVLPEFGGSACYISQDGFGNGRTSSLLKYEVDLPIGVHLGLQYVAPYLRKDAASKTKELVNQGDGLGIAIVYETPLGVGLGAAYSQTENRFSNALGQYARMGVGGIKFAQKKGWHLGATYSQTGNLLKPFKGDEADDFAKRSWGYEVILKYQGLEKVTPSLGYLEQSVLHPNKKESAIAVRFAEVGANVKLHENVKLALDWKCNRLKKEEKSDKKPAVNASDANVFSMGVLVSLA